MDMSALSSSGLHGGPDVEEEDDDEDDAAAAAAAAAATDQSPA